MTKKMQNYEQRKRDYEEDLQRRNEKKQERKEERQRREEAERLKLNIDEVIKASTAGLTGSGGDETRLALDAVRSEAADYPATSRGGDLFAQKLQERYPELEREDEEELSLAALRIQSAQRARRGRQLYELELERQEEMLREEVKRELINEQEEALQSLEEAYRELGEGYSTSQRANPGVLVCSPVKDELLREEAAVRRRGLKTRGKGFAPPLWA